MKTSIRHIPHEILPPFDSLSALQREMRISLPASREPWRLTTAQVGQINGLPTSRGVRVATNGVLCIIRQSEDNVKWFVGHESMWEVDVVEMVVEVRELVKRSGSAVSVAPNAQDLMIESLLASL